MVTIIKNQLKHSRQLWIKRFSLNKTRLMCIYIYREFLNTNFNGENIMIDDLKSKFDEHILCLYERILTECGGYRPTRFMRMFNEHGGVETAHRLLHAAEYSEGFTKLWELKRLDLSLEAAVLEQPWCNLFSREEIEIARKRLEDYGYEKV